mmetsp:Transcript_95679/g.270768  ORF Transcript_95679/g.270768 Transcript_95679/m.270768 type:complete len:361 (-) Transcript_95679:111-1193(-)
MAGRNSTRRHSYRIAECAGDEPRFHRVFHLHVPKTAGASLADDMRNIFPSWRTKLISREGCFSRGIQEHASQVVTMLRRPRDHVLSLYTHCTTSPEHHRFRSDSQWATMPGSFDAWVRTWAALQEQGKNTSLADPPFLCYNPTNLQSFLLSCDRLRSHEFFRFHSVDSALAVRNMREAFFVGITEAYQESLCLFHAKVCGSLPRYCDRDNAEAWDSFSATHNLHGVKRHSLVGLSEQALQAIDAFTDMDRGLYAAAVERFEREVHEVERAFGRTLLPRAPPGLGLPPLEPPALASTSFATSSPAILAVRGELVLVAIMPVICAGMCILRGARAGTREASWRSRRCAPRLCRRRCRQWLCR